MLARQGHARSLDPKRATSAHRSAMAMYRMCQRTRHETLTSRVSMLAALHCCSMVASQYIGRRLTRGIVRMIENELQGVGELILTASHCKPECPIFLSRYGVHRSFPARRIALHAYAHVRILRRVIQMGVISHMVTIFEPVPALARDTHGWAGGRQLKSHLSSAFFVSRKSQN